MDLPTHYLGIEPIFDLTLFGIENAEDYFANEKLSFSKEFLFYQKDLLANENIGIHVIECLLYTLITHFTNRPFISILRSFPVQFFAKGFTDIRHYNSIELNKPHLAGYFFCDWVAPVI